MSMTIADQMGRALQKTSVSTIVKEHLDSSCTMSSPHGGPSLMLLICSSYASTSRKHAVLRQTYARTVERQTRKN